MTCPGCGRDTRSPHPKCLTRAPAPARAPAREAEWGRLVQRLTQAQRDAILRRIPSTPRGR